MQDPILAAVLRANQRGERPLSMIDLIEAGTLTRLQCAWLLDRIMNGSSWLVGASPGGAGKTTIMSALLAMVPPPNNVYITRPGSGWERATNGDCAVCYEISRGAGYDGYIFRGDVKQLCALGRAGCRIVANLHADTLEQAREQIVTECGATEEQFQSFGLFLPIRVGQNRHAVTRVIDRIMHVENGAWHVMDSEPGRTAAVSRIAETLAGLQRDGMRSVEEVRTRWLTETGGG